MGEDTNTTHVTKEIPTQRMEFGAISFQRLICNKNIMFNALLSDSDFFYLVYSVTRLYLLL